MSGIEKIDRPFDKWTTYEGHGGIDYGQGTGTPIPASRDGVVTFADFYSDRGGYAVFVDYGLGYLAGYYHINSKGDIKVKLGDSVKRGTILALVGELGQYSTGPHLHHEIWVNGNIIKPPYYWNYVNDGDNDYVGSTDENNTTTPEIKDDDMPIFVEDKEGKRGRAVILGDKWVPLADGGEIKTVTSRPDVPRWYLTTAEFDDWKNLYGRANRRDTLSEMEVQQVTDAVNT